MEKTFWGVLKGTGASEVWQPIVLYGHGGGIFNGSGQAVLRRKLKLHAAEAGGVSLLGERLVLGGS